jgi:hypothetical protein
VDWYRFRWMIEQLFRTLKKQGLDLESSQLEQGESLMKLAVLAVQVAVTTLQLVLSRDGQAEQPISVVFNHKEIVLLSVLLGQYEGRTSKTEKSPPQEPAGLGILDHCTYRGLEGLCFRITTRPHYNAKGVAGVCNDV